MGDDTLAGLAFSLTHAVFFAACTLHLSATLPPFVVWLWGAVERAVGADGDQRWTLLISSLTDAADFIRDNEELFADYDLRWFTPSGAEVDAVGGGDEVEGDGDGFGRENAGEDGRAHQVQGPRGEAVR